MQNSMYFSAMNSGNRPSMLLSKHWASFADHLIQTSSMAFGKLSEIKEIDRNEKQKEKEQTWYWND